ncbi:MAG: DUF3050 domain-containing protein [Desulfobacterales bacterium]|nr:MAG: DUF3050 domain-containing protein [Desulfobacterales bacterium]
MIITAFTKVIPLEIYGCGGTAPIYSTQEVSQRANFVNLSKTFSGLETRQQLLENHPVFASLRERDDLQLFMSWHVFAVWDFMSLVKRLQRELTCIDIPWTPPKYPQAARLINEIVLGEESDELPTEGHVSHYELYLKAMNEIGADTSRVEEFISMLLKGNPVNEALNNISVHNGIRNFVNNTMHVVENGTIHEVLGSFFFGRENIIPQMFKQLLEEWQIDENEAPVFVYYLKRHIELDSETHGPAAMKIIEELTRDNPIAIQQLTTAAEHAIDARLAFWNELKLELESRPAEYIKRKATA